MRKKKIVILGSTGSIGTSTLEVLKKEKSNFCIELLTANNNYKKLIKQAKIFKPKNVLIKNSTFKIIVEKNLIKEKIKVFSGDVSILNILKCKVDYTMSAIVGIAGLQPTLDAIKISRNVALANKETIICGWELLAKQLKKYKTNILPVDSEHFSIMELTKGLKDKDLEEIIITASGGPLLNLSSDKLKKVKPAQAINHPTWKMGKKISVDSANLMNKVFEVIEANKIFNFKKNKYKVIIHPQSYVHSIIRFKSGLIKMLLHNTDMKIPISNIIFGEKNHLTSIKNIDVDVLNNLSFQNVNRKKFPSLNLIEKCLKSGLLAPTILNASNEILVDLFLSNKIKFTDIVENINRIFRDKDFKKYARKNKMSLKNIKIADNWARLKTTSLCVK
ncbi:MAG: 1-deoxy-D-xylulose-5-phosphate reductoisomerase [Pelagibacterales bacterium]|nr:1-deoxy-D-xylulose-5-phosphate reductoisomerase [Pelagibacterales bacterium]